MLGLDKNLGRFEKKKKKNPNTLGLDGNLGHIDIVLPCQTHVSCALSELRACFGCEVLLRMAKSRDISDVFETCPERGPGVLACLWRALGLFKAYL